MNYYWDFGLKTFNHDYGVDHCANCRALLYEPCVDCQTERDAVGIGEMTENLKSNISECLKIYKKEKSIFNVLPTDVFHKLLTHIKYVDDSGYNQGCPIIAIESCKHIWHLHCWIQWIKKRCVCPIDNHPIARSEKYVIAKLSWEIGCKKVFGQSTDPNFMTEVNYNVDATVVCIMQKYNKLTREELYKMVQDKLYNKYFIYYNQELFNDRINSLIHRDFLYQYTDEEGVTRYGYYV